MAPNTLYKFPWGMHYFLLDEKSIETLKGEKRAICTLGKVKFHCAVLTQKKLGTYVMVGSGVLKQIGAREGMTVHPKFSRDRSEFQFQMPEEFKEVLRTDTEAKSIFVTLTPGKQRALLYLVQAVKSPDKRIERALTIADRLKQNITSPKLMLKK